MKKYIKTCGQVINTRGQQKGMAKNKTGPEDKIKRRFHLAKHECMLVDLYRYGQMSTLKTQLENFNSQMDCLNLIVLIVSIRRGISKVRSVLNHPLI